MTGAWKAEEGYNQIIGKYRNFEELADADLTYLSEVFEPLGLTSRAENLIEMSQEIIEKFGGELPANFEKLIEINGVGRYTANAILCFSYKKKAPIADRNVKRIFERYFNYESDKPPYADNELWKLADILLPSDNYVEYNLSLLDFSAKVCTYTKPSCNNCPLFDSCIYIMKLEE